MSTDHLVRHEVRPDGTGGRYVIHHGEDVAELTYSVASPSLVIADHTGVPDGLRGTGAGLALVQKLVEDARRQGFRIKPMCSFVIAQRKRHPEWARAFTN